MAPLARDCVVAIDVGGTKLAVGMVDSGGTVVRSGRTATPNADGETIWAALNALLDEVVAGAEPMGVGVGCGGPLRMETGEVSPLNMPGWRDFPLVDRLRLRFPDVPVVLHNDAVAMAIGEHWRGAGQGASTMLGIVVSTGVGGGLVIGNRVVSGRTGNAGHVGHVTVDPKGPLCGCGNSGCLEAIARGPAVIASALDGGWEPTSGVADGASLVADCMDRVAPGTCESLTRAGRALGVAVAGAANLLELERVVVGGGLAVGAGDLLLEPARLAFGQRARMGFARRCEIVPAALGNEAGLVGAAAMILVPHYLADADGAT
ncbi:MAG TPA: ROK family protein [Mycobacteriales bacterium]|nr:ROK family protein [Mycobacteriales bacterium]